MVSVVGEMEEELVLCHPVPLSRNVGAWLTHLEFLVKDTVMLALRSSLDTFCNNGGGNCPSCMAS